MTFQKIQRIIIITLVLLMALTPSSWAKKKAKYTGVTAKAAIFSDSTKVKRLYGKNVHTKVLPASTTKVMTALLVLENLSLDKTVRVSHAATLAAPSKIFVRTGESYRVSDLLYALLLNSANDASIVLAEAVAGSETKFVQRMNQRARELGAEHTKFANSSGLPTSKISQHTTAYDMYLIFRQALKHAFFRKAIEHKYKVIHSTAGRRVALKSHNKILFFSDWKRPVYGKTGYTRGAKACFVGTIQKGESTLIIAVFGCSRRWDDIKYIIRHYGGIPL